MPPFHPRNSNFCLLPCKAIFVSCHIRNLFVADALYIIVDNMGSVGLCCAGLTGTTTDKKWENVYRRKRTAI